MAVDAGDPAVAVDAGDPAMADLDSAVAVDAGDPALADLDSAVAVDAGDPAMADLDSAVAVDAGDPAMAVDVRDPPHHSSVLPSYRFLKVRMQKMLLRCQSMLCEHIQLSMILYSTVLDLMVERLFCD